MENRIILRRHALPLALIGAVVASSIVGCGGGVGTNPFNPGATPTPTTPTPIALTPATFMLANGQSVTLTGTRTGNNISGVLKVAAKAALKARLTANATFPFQLTAGDYAYTGTVTPPRTFEISGNFGTFGNFSMSGLLPTATEDGSFSLTTNGVTDSGVIPHAGTPTTTPTPPPTGGNYALNGTLAVSNVTAGSPVITSPFNSFTALPNDGLLTNTSVGTQTLSLGASDTILTGPGTRRDLAIGLASGFVTSTPSLVPFSMGQRFTLGQNFVNLVQYAQTTITATSTNIHIWRPISGELVVRAIGPNSISLEFVNVRMRGVNVTGSVDTTAGEFTFNGTVAATGLVVKTS